MSLSVSQPALTSAIQELEFTVGVRLFDRGTRFVRLTPSGEKIRPNLERMLSSYLSGVQDIQQILQREDDTIRIAYVPETAQLVTTLILKWKQTHPMVKLYWTDVSEELLTASVESTDFDIGFGMDLSTSEKLNAYPIAQEQIVIIMSPRHAFAESASLQLKDLRGLPVVILARGNHLQMIKCMLDNSDPYRLSVYQTVSHVESMYSMVDSDLFVGLVSSLYEASYRARGFVAFKVSVPTLSRHVSVVMRKGLLGQCRSIVQDCWEYFCKNSAYSIGIPP